MRLFLVVVNLRKELVFENDKSHKNCKNAIVFTTIINQIVLNLIWVLNTKTIQNHQIVVQNQILIEKK